MASVWDIFKVNRKTFWNPSAWIDVNFLRYSNRVMWNIIRGAVTTETPEREESFDQAMKRLKVTKGDLHRAQIAYFTYAILFLILGILVLLLSFYLLFAHRSISALLIGLATSALFVAQAFRFHFWYFQIKHHKLGCTFDEWWRGKTIEEEKRK